MARRTKIVISLLALCLAPSLGFIREASLASPLQGNISVNNKKSKQHSPNANVRGGAEPLAALADYSGAAKALFGNLLGPASMLAGGLVPLGFLAAPIAEDGTKWKRKAKLLYMTIAVGSLVHELLAIMYATVATNKLVEVVAPPTRSVFELIQRDYEMEWLAVNVNFMMGLLGFCSLITLRALCLYPGPINVSSAGLALSGLVGMVSIVNAGVATGDGQGHNLGCNIVSLGARYLTLLSRNILKNKPPLAFLSLVMFSFFLCKTIQNLWMAES